MLSGTPSVGTSETPVSEGQTVMPDNEVAPSAPVAAPLNAAPPSYPGAMPGYPGAMSGYNTPNVMGGAGNWVDARAGQIPPGAVVGGQDFNVAPSAPVAAPLYAGAAPPGYPGAMPGYNAPNGMGGAGNRVDARAGQIPPNAVAGGQDFNVARWVPLAASLFAALPGLLGATPGVLGATPAFNAPNVMGGADNWVDARAGRIPPGAVVGGRDCNGETLYVARARHQGGVIPGKLCASHGHACIPWGGKEHLKREYQVLVGGPNNWVRVKGANVPPGAFRGGQSENGEPLYVGRVYHKGSLTTGKVQKSHGVCYISFGGRELGFRDYEVLVS